MENLIVVKQLPIIEEQLKTLSKEIDEKVKIAVALVCTEENKQEIKKVRTNLGNQFKELEEQRKLVKNKILEPYEAFNNIYKTCIEEKFKTADNSLKIKIDAIEIEQKSKLENEAQRYFEELKQSKNIEFLKFANLNLKIGISDNNTKLSKQIKAFVEKVEEELKLIETQQYRDEIIVEYKQSLNVANAITIVNDRHIKLEEEKKMQEELFKTKEIEEKVIEKVNHIIQTPIVEDNKYCSMTFCVSGTKEQLKQVKQFLKSGGYKYEAR